MDEISTLPAPAPEFIPLEIQVKASDGLIGSVCIKWDPDDKKFYTVCKNATLEEGAKKFFDYLIEALSGWIEEFCKGE